MGMKVHSMIKPIKITAETVFSVATQLEKQNIEPSLRTVRTMLGGGSFSTIGPLLHSWRRERQQAREENPETTSDHRHSPLSPRLAAALDRLSEATQNIANEIRLADRDRTTLQAQETARMRSEIIKLQNLAEIELTALRDERKNLKNQLEKTHKEVTNLREWRLRAVAHIKALGGKIG